jgi:hypothetical protein
MTTDEEALTVIAKLNAYQLGGRAHRERARPKLKYAGGGPRIRPSVSPSFAKQKCGWHTIAWISAPDPLSFR